MLEDLPSPASPEHEKDRALPGAVLEDLASPSESDPGLTRAGSEAPTAGGEGEGRGESELPVRSVEEIELLLDSVEAALARLDEGSYGTCTSCGGPIDESRLAAVPVATRCASCPEAPAEPTAHRGRME